MLETTSNTSSISTPSNNVLNETTTELFNGTHNSFSFGSISNNLTFATIASISDTSAQITLSGSSINEMGPQSSNTTQEYSHSSMEMTTVTVSSITTSSILSNDISQEPINNTSVYISQESTLARSPYRVTEVFTSITTSTILSSLFSNVTGPEQTNIIEGTFPNDSVPTESRTLTTETITDRVSPNSSPNSYSTNTSPEPLKTNEGTISLNSISTETLPFTMYLMNHTVPSTVSSVNLSMETMPELLSTTVGSVVIESLNTELSNTTTESTIAIGLIVTPSNSISNAITTIMINNTEAGYTTDLGPRESPTSGIGSMNLTGPSNIPLSGFSNEMPSELLTSTHIGATLNSFQAELSSATMETITDNVTPITMSSSILMGTTLKPFIATDRSITFATGFPSATIESISVTQPADTSSIGFTNSSTTEPLLSFLSVQVPSPTTTTDEISSTVSQVRTSSITLHEPLPEIVDNTSGSYTSESSPTNLLSTSMRTTTMTQSINTFSLDNSTVIAPPFLDTTKEFLPSGSTPIESIVTAMPTTSPSEPVSGLPMSFSSENTTETSNNTQMLIPLDSVHTLSS
ncbi:unnamed protein product, partial [Rotaria magnacalcarata]